MLDIKHHRSSFWMSFKMYLRQKTKPWCNVCFTTGSLNHLQSSKIVVGGNQKCWYFNSYFSPFQKQSGLCCLATTATIQTTDGRQLFQIECTVALVTLHPDFMPKCPLHWPGTCKWSRTTDSTWQKPGIISLVFFLSPDTFFVQQLEMAFSKHATAIKS